MDTKKMYFFLLAENIPNVVFISKLHCTHNTNAKKLWCRSSKQKGNINTFLNRIPSDNSLIMLFSSSIFVAKSITTRIEV